MLMLRASLLLALSLSTAALAANNNLPPDDQTIRPITKSGFPHVVQLLNWNVQKAEQGPNFVAEMQEFARGRNLLTLQEGYEIPLMTSTLAALPGLNFHMAAAFVYREKLTGVITGAVAEPVRTEFRRSPDREPILNSPKITGFSYYRIDAQRDLLVANLHGINFVGPDKFRNQLENVAEALAAHNGPIILAGDFNTWNAARSEILNEIARRLGLEEVGFGPAKNKKAELDHVFVKGCQVLKAWMPDAAKGSDHLPQFVDLSCGQN